jgi:VWFA-related protein
VLPTEGMATRGTTACSAFVVLLLGVPSAQTPAPTYRARTTLVEVDVTVKDASGHFVTGLTAADFDVRDGGTPREVEAIYLVDGGPARAPSSGGSKPAPAQPLATSVGSPADASPRVWILWFDLDHMAAGGLSRARLAVSGFLDGDLLPGDIGGVVAGGTLINGRMTSVREELQAAVNAVKVTGDARSIELTMREWPRFVSLYEAYQVDRADDKYVERVMARACADDADRCRGADPRLEVLHKARTLAAEARASAAHTLQSLTSLMAELRRVPGRKTVVFLSDGFVSEDTAAIAPVVMAAAQANVRVYVFDTRGLNRGSAGSAILDAPPQQRVVTDKTFGAEPPDFDFSSDGPNALAADTGGVFIRNENDARRALTQIAEDARSFYVLAFRQPDGAREGTVRPIRVQVKRDGLTVRARKAYVVGRPVTATGPLAKPAPSADPTRALPPGVPADYVVLLDSHVPGRFDPAEKKIAEAAVLDLRSAPRWFADVDAAVKAAVDRARKDSAKPRDRQLLADLQAALRLSDAEVEQADISGLVALGLALHTDAALDTFEILPANAEHNLRAAEALADRLSAQRPGTARDWYVVASEFLTDKSPWLAGELLQRGLKRLPNDPGVWLAMGTLDQVMASPEMQRVYVGAWNDKRFQSVVHGAMANNKREYVEIRAVNSGYVVENRKGQLTRAEKAFLRALALEPTNAEARLRLGDVLAQQGRGKEALPLLDQVRREASDRTVRYLASMLAGRLHQDEGRLEAARTSYESAFAEVPGSQSASIALSHLASREGNRRAAVSDLGAGPLAAFASDDPWWGYATGAGRHLTAALASIREAARTARRPK